MIRVLLAALVLALASPAAADPSYTDLLDAAKDGDLTEEQVAALREKLHPVQFTEGAKRFVNGENNVDSAELYFATPSMDVLYGFLDRGLNRMIERRDDHLAGKGGRGRLYAWYWGYYGRAAINLYEASGERRFLDLVVETYRRLLAERDDALGLVDDERGEVMPSWGTLYDSGVRSNEVTTAGLITLPACEFLQLADHDVSVRRHYSEVVADFRVAAVETLKEFLPELRQVENGRGAYFYHLTDDIVEPLNHAHVFGAAAARCAPFTDGLEPVVRDLAAYFQEAIVKHPNGTYSWAYKPTPDNMTDRRAEAIWKAAVTIELPAAAYEEGLAFDRADLRAIVRTLSHNVADGRDMQHFIGTERDIVLGERFAGTSLPGGVTAWAMLECHVPGVRDTLLELMTANPGMFPNAWLGGSRVPILALSLMLEHHDRPSCRPPES